jgi:hypothetical protein
MWIKGVWKSLLGYLSHYHTLVRGQLDFHFRTKEDATNILKLRWFSHLWSLTVKKRSLCIDLSLKRIIIVSKFVVPNFLRSEKVDEQLKMDTSY